MRRIQGITGVTLLFLCWAFVTNGQDSLHLDKETLENHFLNTVSYKGEVIPWAFLPEVEVNSEIPKKLRKKLAKKVKKYNRLRNAVYVTYPFARIAAGVLHEVDDKLEQLPDKKEKKEYLSFKEKELKQSFGPKIEDLSMYQGRVLIKLIYRETGDNCYNLIKELKGGFSARFWQTVAFFFGGNLKEPYDKTENADIESIVQELQYNPIYYNAYQYRDKFH